MSERILYIFNKDVNFSKITIIKAGAEHKKMSYYNGNFWCPQSFHKTLHFYFELAYFLFTFCVLC